MIVLRQGTASRPNKSSTSSSSSYCGLDLDGLLVLLGFRLAALLPSRDMDGWRQPVMAKSRSLLDPTRKKLLVDGAREVGADADAKAGVLLPLEPAGDARGRRDADRPRSSSSVGVMGSPSSKMVPGSSVRRGEGEGMMPSGFGCATYSIVASEPSTRSGVACSSTSLRASKREERPSALGETRKEEGVRAGFERRTVSSCSCKRRGAAARRRAVPDSGRGASRRGG